MTRRADISGRSLESGPSGDLTAILAARIMGWRVCPDRFLLSNRRWIPRWRFQPFAELADAFQLLDHAACHYTLIGDGRTFTAEVQIGSGQGKASGSAKARTITLAFARALGLEGHDQT